MDNIVLCGAAQEQDRQIAFAPHPPRSLAPAELFSLVRICDPYTRTKPALCTALGVPACGRQVRHSGGRARMRASPLRGPVCLWDTYVSLGAFQ